MGGEDREKAKRGGGRKKQQWEEKKLKLLFGDNFIRPGLFKRGGSGGQREKAAQEKGKERRTPPNEKAEVINLFYEGEGLSSLERTSDVLCKSLSGNGSMTEKQS